MFLISSVANNDKSKFPKPPPNSLRNAKRSSSNSNDQVYERDRFQSRLNSFHLLNSDHTDNPSLPQSKLSSLSNLSNLQNILTKTTKNTNMFNEKYIEGIDYENNPLEITSNYLSTNSMFDNYLNIKFVSSNQLIHILSWYFTNTLPIVDKMFPWLHGLHKENISQRCFMNNTNDFTTQIETLVPKVRNIMMVRSNCISDRPSENIINSTGCMKNSVDPAEILDSLNISRLSLVEYIDVLLTDLNLNLKLTNILVNDCIELKVLPVFKNLDPKKGVSLRNFNIQVSKISHISDFIVYCFNEEHNKLKADSGHGFKDCKCASLTRILKLAQLNFQLSNPEILEFISNENENNDYGVHDDGDDDDTIKIDNRTFFNTYLLEKSNLNFFLDGNEFFLSTKPISQNSLTKLPGNLYSDYELQAFNNWDTDYAFKEKLEIARMSSATKLENIWVGNSTDFNVFEIYKLKNILDEIKDENISCPPYFDHSNSIMNIKDEIITDETLYIKPKANWKMFIYCFGEASFPDLKTLENHLQSNDKEEIHIDFPPSGSIGIGDCNTNDILSLINLCKLMYFRSDSKFPALMFCSDGYTETSLLLLSYLIYSKGIKLNQALIELHSIHNRPFYVFSTDTQLLLRLEALLLMKSPVLNNDIDPLSLEDISYNTFCQTLYQPVSCEKNEWVSKCHGSLPSRILPHLYLGNLNHANNLPLLKEIGITKIISVGEQLDWITDKLDIRETGGVNDCKVLNFTNKHFPISKIMKINNLQDDGIDELISILTNALEFIEECYQNNEKVLVHCRVGVSRSATVCIAEVMKRLNYSLSKSYLFIRVRRLNVIIQPNLRFMYELFKWQEINNLKNRKERTISALTDSTTLRSDSINEITEIDDVLKLQDNYLYSIDSLNSDTSSCSLESNFNSNCNNWLRDIDWFVLCREIDILNKAYITD